MFEVSGHREEDLLHRMIKFMVLSSTIQGSVGGLSISPQNLTPIILAEACSCDFDPCDILLILAASGAMQTGTTPASTTPPNFLQFLPFILGGPKFDSRRSRFVREIEEGKADKKARRLQLELDKIRSELADADVRLRTAEDTLAVLRARTAEESKRSDRLGDEQD
jgi:hypothetical protein